MNEDNKAELRIPNSGDVYTLMCTLIRSTGDIKISDIASKSALPEEFIKRTYQDIIELDADGDTFRISLMYKDLLTNLRSSVKAEPNKLKAINACINETLNVKSGGTSYPVRSSVAEIGIKDATSLNYFKYMLEFYLDIKFDWVTYNSLMEDIIAKVETKDN